MQDIPRILDELRSASLRVISSESPEELVQAILIGLAELCGTHQAGFVVERKSGCAYRVYANKMSQSQIEALVACFQPDESQNQKNPVIIQLTDQDPSSHLTFRENGWFSTVLVPVNRDKFSIMVWAARGEDMPGFSEHELTAVVLLAQCVALMFESYRSQMIFDHLFGVPGLEQGLTPEEIMITTGATLSINGRLREGNSSQTYLTSVSSQVKGDVYSPGAEISFNDKKRTITNGTATVHLTMTEARLFQVLWNHQNEMLLHVELVQMTHGYQVDVEEASKILRPVVSRLRKKLRAFLNGERWIKNVRGTGYVMGEV